jgi:hypothetical protein
VKLLNRNNPNIDVVLELLEDQQYNIIRVAKRTTGLYDHIKDVLCDYCLPIVDRKFGYVLDCHGGHEMIIAAIHAYNEGMDGREPPGVREDAWGPYWLEAMTGYYFTGARGSPQIWVPTGYRPDKLDRDIFIEHGVLKE